MLALRTTAAMERAAINYPDPELRQLLTQRMQTLRSHFDGDLEEIVHFLIIEPGDTPLEMEMEAELGWSPLVNRVDGTRFGDPAFEPGWEAIQCHGRWFSIIHVVSDYGFGWILFIANDPGTHFDLHSLCLEYACRCSS
jgi:hypothetical protein